MRAVIVVVQEERAGRVRVILRLLLEARSGRRSTSSAIRFRVLGLASYAGGPDLSDDAQGCGAGSGRLGANARGPLRDFPGDLPGDEKGFG
jgi:hypothetical protein